MTEILEWLANNVWAVVLGVLLFVAVIGIWVYVAMSHPSKVQTDSEDGFPG